MNIEKLIKAARKIDALKKKLDERTNAWQQLSSDARKPDAKKQDIDRRKKELDWLAINKAIDFEPAIQELQEALIICSSCSCN